MYIHELHLRTHHLDQQRAFYTETLALTLVEANADRFTLQVGTSTLTFHAAENASPVYTHFAFNIPEHLFAAAKVWLRASVDLLTSPDGQDEFHFESWNAHAVYFADPGGNIGELIARHDLPSAHNEPFHSGHLLNVSEIGLPSDDVVALAQHLQAVVGLPVYRGEVNESFTAMGDEHGLFILVKTGRKWYPNGEMPAKARPVSVLISTESGARFQIDGDTYRIIDET